MAETNRFTELNNGKKMPLMGYGTFLSQDEKALHDNIVYAVVDCGYRHIDTASLYGNEHVVGDALQECFEKGIKREDIFITTKLWRSEFGDVDGSLKKSLEKLKLEYVDLYLIHWTVTDVDWDTYEIKGPPMHEVWTNMEKQVDAGLTKSIGVSNCNAMLFVDMLAGAKIKPVNNQIENNPHLAQKNLVEFTKKFGCTTTAYAPIGASGFTGYNMLDDETLKKIAEKHNASAAQIALAWNMQRGVIVIPKSMNKERIKENYEALSVDLSEEDVEEINKIDQGKRNFDPAGWDSPEYGWKYAPMFD